MEIKKQLKALNIKISKLASDLQISRPTLDSYIDRYEKDEILSNSAYQRIFNFLFCSENLTSIDFARKYDYVKKHMLPQCTSICDEEKETLGNRRDSLNYRIQEYLSKKNLDDKLLEFIHLLISNQNLPLVKAISTYFCSVNGLVDFDSATTDEKNIALFSHLFQLFRMYMNDSIQLNEESFRAFQEKCKVQFKKRNSSTEDAIGYLKQIGDVFETVDLEFFKQIINKEDSQ